MKKLKKGIKKEVNDMTQQFLLKLTHDDLIILNELARIYDTKTGAIRVAMRVLAQYHNIAIPADDNLV